MAILELRRLLGFVGHPLHQHLFPLSSDYIAAWAVSLLSHLESWGFMSHSSSLCWIRRQFVVWFLVTSSFVWNLGCSTCLIPSESLILELKICSGSWLQCQCDLFLWCVSSPLEGSVLLAVDDQSTMVSLLENPPWAYVSLYFRMPSMRETLRICLDTVDSNGHHYLIHVPFEWIPFDSCHSVASLVGMPWLVVVCSL